MKAASYRSAVKWIAVNDSNGDCERLAYNVVSELITTALVADIFGEDPIDVAIAVVRERVKADAEEKRDRKRLEREIRI